MIVIGDRGINVLTVIRSAPLDASEVTAWPNLRDPKGVAVIGIKRIPALLVLVGSIS
jgi:hypothetical protein